MAPRAVLLGQVSNKRHRFDPLSLLREMESLA